MKRIVSIAIILFLILELTGCEAIQRKFTRKRKREPIKPRFYQEGVAETRPNLEVYMMHYMYWKTWQEELVTNAGANTKRDILACDEVVNNLMDMKNYLGQEKAKELDSYIQQIEKITQEIKSGGFTPMRLGFLKQRLDNIKGRIIRKFYYKKVKEGIKPDRIGGEGDKKKSNS